MRKIYIKVSDADSTLKGLWRKKFKKKSRHNKQSHKFKKKALAPAPIPAGHDGVTSIEELRSRRQRLRSNPTPSELLFKSRLKAAGVDFIFQCIVGFYIPDFVIATHSVIVELDGSAHDNSAEYDKRRDKFLTSCGFHVLRIPNAMAASYDIGSILALKGYKPLGNCLGSANNKRNQVMIKNRKRAALCATPAPLPRQESTPAPLP